MKYITAEYGYLINLSHVSQIRKWGKPIQPDTLERTYTIDATVMSAEGTEIVSIYTTQDSNYIELKWKQLKQLMADNDMLLPALSPLT